MEREVVTHTFPSFFDENSKILILGSIPSVVSREEGFYYMHPSNRFWKVLANVYEEEVPETISLKKDFLTRHQIALWDVIASCRIHASSDASITDVQVNDISSLLAKTKVKRIFVTGKRAYELYQRYLYPEVKKEAILLPSPSSANASCSFDYLVQAYSILREENVS